ncbi:hypothetical protein CEXT_387421 [Caerostris extrusa]|uniref:Uncharacterized protein n=1 Tax=Caerostris extrusa TaxID=172846 RepID=A0AAV4P4D6_CAEEX|nr:hypothetical protein CEXT_387421 [Caerostris extrusa]
MSRFSFLDTQLFSENGMGAYQRPLAIFQFRRIHAQKNSPPPPPPPSSSHYKKMLHHTHSSSSKTRNSENTASLSSSAGKFHFHGRICSSSLSYALLTLPL